MIKDLLKMLEAKRCLEKIVSTYKMTEPQKKLWAEVESADEKSKAARKTAEIMRKKFWNKIEGDNNDFIHNLKINTEEMVIEAYEEDCDNCDSSK